MKKSRVFLTAGTLVLAITAIFATKANKKFTPSIRTGVQESGHLVIKIPSGTTFMTTSSAGGADQLQMALHGSAAENLVTKGGTSTSKSLYYN